MRKTSRSGTREENVQMNIPKIDHIGIMVKDLEAAKRTYSEGLGLKLAKEEINEAHGLKVAFFSCGEVMKATLRPWASRWPSSPAAR